MLYRTETCSRPEPRPRTPTPGAGKGKDVDLALNHDTELNISWFWARKLALDPLPYRQTPNKTHLMRTLMPPVRPAILPTSASPILHMSAHAETA
ncbi:hypothetical protein Cob_v000451 [Colletotrichum orbiculare MAFF 240422]|uniref:Uncharacterized protein n=1 Tax=Colletotrichum orbiculare (strain 104-T / ATCC 96160 / CBS 514.97 / LARS 414 / MAFF 240422) TaxID=1213857 RepID=A0A484GA76_COLOR|nr:hypothetical protein Cob_v000451 [Colletotrichum orbiculare MAFF 240422]